jgi:hypothetical protein
VTSYNGHELYHGSCPKRLGPKEQENIFRFTQNEFYEDLEFTDCYFIGTGITTYGAAKERSCARNIRIAKCRANSFFGTGAIFDEIVVDGLLTSRSPVILFGCAFRHVVVKGDCGSFIINRNVCHDDKERNAAFDAANASFYESVDWALDISELRSYSFEIRGSVPIDLIRRNPDEQFVMTREVAQNGEWERFGPYNSFSIAISIFLDSGAESELFVAGRRSKKFKELLAYYQRLKAAGLVT